MKSQIRKNSQKNSKEQNMFLFKLVSLNVRKADVIFFQEKHSKGELEKQWMNEWGGKIFYSHGSQNSCGVTVLIRKDLIAQLKKLDPLGRFIVLN